MLLRGSIWQIVKSISQPVPVLARDTGAEAGRANFRKDLPHPGHRIQQFAIPSAKKKGPGHKPEPFRRDADERALS